MLIVLVMMLRLWRFGGLDMFAVLWSPGFKYGRLPVFTALDAMADLTL